MIIFLFLILPFSISSQMLPGDDWKLRKDEEGIQVYTRDAEGSDIDELKVVSTFHASLSAVVAVIMDANNFPNWIYACTEGKILNQPSPTEQYQYQLMNAPYPIADRDIVTHFTLTQDKNTGVVSTTAAAAPDYIPEKDDVVRVPVFIGVYQLTPLAGGNVEVVYTLRMEPGGSIPDWLVNATIVAGPFQSNLEMAKQIQSSKYHDIKLDFIKEP